MQAHGQNAEIAELCASARNSLAKGQPGEALQQLQHTLETAPQLLEPQYLASESEFALGNREAAVARLITALQSTPSPDPMIYLRLGDMCSALGQVGNVQIAHRHALGRIARNQSIQPPFHNIFFSTGGAADFDTVRMLGDIWEFFSSIPQEQLHSFFLRMFPYTLSVEENRKLLALCRLSAEKQEQEAKTNPLPGTAAPYTGDKIGLAFMASLFANNNVAKFLMPALEILATRDDIEIHYFSTIETIATDPIQERVREIVHAYQDVSSLEPRAVAETIREAGCHAVIDMDGYARWSKTAAMCYRPCELQISWMNWPGSLGISQVDAIIADQYATPEIEGVLCERPMIMQGPYYITGVLSEEPVSEAPPCIENGYITFGTQSSVYKYTSALICLWSEVLRKVENSRFLIVRPECGNPVFKDNMIQEFARNGVAAERINFIDNKATGKSHMCYYNDIDIFLDSVPLTGGTTTMESLWMGVPVITYAGCNVHQRVSHAILSHLGLQELSGDNSADYIAHAVALAENRDRLGQLKTGLRDRLCSSKLFDAAAFSDEFVDLLRATLDGTATAEQVE